MDEGLARIDTLWVQKYRPRSFDQILNQDTVKALLRRIIASKNLPNLFLSGPAGTGKSSTAEVVARELFGDGWEGNFTEINASNVFEQGRKYLKASRTLARFYDERRSVLDNFKRITNQIAGIAPLAAPYRVLFINEAEALTFDAQQALRRIIERYNRTCKFILATERPSRVIIPIRSRCLPLHFTQFSVSILLSYLRWIAASEGYQLSDELGRSIIQLCDKNLQKALTVLQLVAKGDTDSAGSLELEKVRDSIRPHEVLTLLQLACEDKPVKSKELLDRLLLDTGLSGSEILAQARADARRLPLDDEARAKLLVILSKADYLLIDSLNDRIQLEALIYEIASNIRRVATASD